MKSKAMEWMGIVYATIDERPRSPGESFDELAAIAEKHVPKGCSLF